MSTQANTPAPPPAPAPGARTGKPGRMEALAALTALEGAALVVGGISMLVMGLLGHPQSPQQAVTGGATLAALGVIPLAAARGLLLRRSWSRGPTLITQIMALPVAYTLLKSQGGLIPTGIALAAVAITALVLVLNPATTRELGIDRGPRPAPEDR
ncbi:hypothetical protein [Streptomyces sp. AM 2-1-1]|uniref:hypothetical protein n=1 Tax=unclassified Streptomyces TaxID=2593676 RepID=UPI0023B96778|nr:hypothetical protein [Streptomyces sp. AM 2-1-1]WEH39742.1 hypothetical protein PZB77_09550 [Streptomyces sp. AM 2-1-1]